MRKEHGPSETINGEMLEKRNLYWDIVKGLAIICVVLGHAIYYTFGIMDAKSNAIYLFIYTFHMPLFALVSGYFFYQSQHKHSNLAILKKRFTQMVVPIVLFGTVFHLCTFDASLPIKRQILAYSDVLGGHLWFLWAILAANVLMIGAPQKTGMRWLYFSLIIIVSFILPDYFNSAGIKFLFPFFLVGYMASQYGTFDKMTDQINILLPMALVLFALLFIPFTSKYTFYESGYCILKNPFGMMTCNIYRFLIGLIGSIAILLLVFQICKVKVCATILRPIGFAGRYTLWIYILHFYLNYLIGYQWGFGKDWMMSSTLFCIVYFIVLFGISLSLSVLVQDYILSPRRHKCLNFSTNCKNNC